MTTDLNLTIERLQAGEKAWASTSLTDRRALLLQVGATVAAEAEAWVTSAAEIKQLDRDSPAVGEEWMSGPYAMLAYIGALSDTVYAIEQGHSPVAGFPTTAAPDGRVALQILPHHVFDKLLLQGYRAEVWMQPGVSAEEARETAGLALRTPGATGGVAVVLGAGNNFSIAPLDVLYQLFAYNRAVVLKLNPITDALGDLFRTVFAPLVELGVVEIVHGGADLGSALAHHPGITAVHMTGSQATHDAIVWGGETRTTVRRVGRRRLDKPVTSELGGVCPVIVVPGRWSTADLRLQAEHVATQRLHNGGFNCVAAQIVILSADWPQKDAFLTELRKAMGEAEPRVPWYPGCEARVQAARELHPEYEAVGARLERTLLLGLDLADPEETAFSTEYFGPVLGIAELPGAGPEFLSAAVDVANRRLHGTLGVNLIIHPRTARALGSRLLRAIADLRYGTVAVNAWTGLGYVTPRATWGAFPGHTLEDVQSGIGVVHNALLLDRVERTVVYGPFRPVPKPAWFVSNKTAATTARRLTQFSAQPQWRRLLAIVASAVRG